MLVMLGSDGECRMHLALHWHFESTEKHSLMEELEAGEVCDLLEVTQLLSHSRASYLQPARFQTHSK